MSIDELREIYAAQARLNQHFVLLGEPTASDLLADAIENPCSAFCGPRSDVAA